MPICNKLLAAAAMTALFAAPTFADGIPGQQVNRGPSALQAHTMTPPEPGCVLVNGNQWSCPVPQARFTSTHSATTHRAAPTRTASTMRTTTHRAPTVTRSAAKSSTYHGSHNHSHGGQTSTRAYTGTHTHGHTHGAATSSRTVTRTVTRAAPTTTRTVTRRAPAPVRTVAVPQQMTLDLGSFSGGVGSGVDGGPVYGGGFVSLGSEPRFSGVLDSRAAGLTFQQRGGDRGGKKRRGGKRGHHGGHHGGGCGC